MDPKSLFSLSDNLDALSKEGDPLEFFQQDAVFQGLVSALDLALRLRVERNAAHMAHGLSLNIGGQRHIYSIRHAQTRKSCLTTDETCGEHQPSTQLNIMKYFGTIRK